MSKEILAAIIDAYKEHFGEHIKIDEDTTFNQLGVRDPHVLIPLTEKAIGATLPQNIIDHVFNGDGEVSLSQLAWLTGGLKTSTRAATHRRVHFDGTPARPGWNL